MAQVHNALRRGPLSAALANAIGDTKGVGGLERYGETLTPVLDLWRQPEWSYLRVERLCADWRTQAAVAAEFSMVALINPALLSRHLIVVEAVTFNATAAGQGRLQIGAEGNISATLATPLPGTVRDGRWGPTNIQNTVGLTLVGSDPAGSLFTSDLDVVATTSAERYEFTVGLPVVLPPGTGLVFGFGTVNIAVNVAIRWRERQALPGELG
jgi:hypothetical protein